LGDGAQGKCECWLILDVGPRGSVSVGLKDALDPAELPTLGVRDDFPQRLHTYRPEPGEGIEILPGTFHTADDLLLLEVQETCDTTYRVFDYGRGREVHLEQAKACLERIPRPRPPRQEPLVGPGRHAITATSPFAFELVGLAADETLDVGAEDAARIVVGLEGTVEVRGAGATVRLGPGQAAVLPACLGQAEVCATGAPARLGLASTRPL
jgi:mannose-6-phosphate isomerase